MSLAENVSRLPQPRSDNYEFARFNALRHGVLSQHTLLPWEDREEYQALLEALRVERPGERLLHDEHHAVAPRSQRVADADAVVRRSECPLRKEDDRLAVAGLDRRSLFGGALPR